jgi:hypothetical protein
MADSHRTVQPLGGIERKLMIDKTRALDGARLLDRLLIDVIVGTRSLEIFERLNRQKTIHPVVFHGMRRMCHSQTLLGLSKFLEFYDAYHDLIPTECKEHCKNIKKGIEAKKIYDFRSKYVAHLIDKSTGRPLDPDQLDHYVRNIFGDDERHFILWVNDQKKKFPETVVSVLERTRDGIMKDHAITKDEMNQWK